MTRLLGLGGLALGGLGCAEVGVPAHPDGPIWANRPSGAMSVVARRALAIAGDRSGEHFERAVAAIDAPNRRLFVGTSDGGLHSLDAATLTSRWRFSTGGGVESEPLYSAADDSVYFGSNDGGVYKLRAADGKLLWRVGTNAKILCAPVLVGEALFVVDANDTLLCIEAGTGKLKWFRQRQPAAGMEISGNAGPAVHGGLIVTGFSDGVVNAYRTHDGSEAWAAPVDLNAQAAESGAADAIRYLDVDTTPVIASVDGEELVFVSSYETGTYALYLASGAEAWHNDGVKGATDLVLWSGALRDGGDKRVLVASSGLGGLSGLEPSTGRELWHRNLEAGGVTAVEPWAGALLVGTSRYGLFLVHPLDGGVIDGVGQGASFAARPSAHGLHAYALSNDGVLLGLGITPPR